MAKPRRSNLVIAILIIGFGVAWLLNVLQVLAGVDWIWTIGLGLTGALTLVFGGVNKLTQVIGPFLVFAAALSIFSQLGHMSLDIELPILMVLLGVLLVRVHIRSLPSPETLRQDDES